MLFRDRIKEFRRVPASQLRPHPNNWRVHPKRQQDALRGLLAEIGYADALLARELPDGTLQLIDGHLRAEATPEAEVPVLVVDLDDAEAAKLLALHDPLVGLAETDNDALAELLDAVETESEAVRHILEDLGEGTEVVDSVQPSGEFPEYDEDIPTEYKCPKCGYEWSGKAG